MKGKAGRTQEFLSRTAAVNSRGSEQAVACSGCSRGTAHRALTAPAAQQLCSVPAFPAHTHTRGQPHKMIKLMISRTDLSSTSSPPKVPKHNIPSGSQRATEAPGDHKRLFKQTNRAATPQQREGNSPKICAMAKAKRSFTARRALLES